MSLHRILQPAIGLERLLVSNIWRSRMKSVMERLISRPSSARPNIFRTRKQLERMLLGRMFLWRMLLGGMLLGGGFLERMLLRRILLTRILPHCQKHRVSKADYQR